MQHIGKVNVTAGMIQVHDVTKTFPGVVALDNVSISVRSGEFFGLLGPNGAGKSTLMNLLVGYRDPDRGEISINGKKVTQAGLDTRTAVGLVPQTLALYEEISAQENLEIFGSLYHIDRKKLKDKIREMLESVQLYDRRKDKVETFSGGMKRRLNLVASLLHDPELLLCDEPTVGVDPQSRNAIFDFLQKLNREGKTIVYTTHYMEEVERLCSRIAIIDFGKVIAEGTIDEVLQKLPFEESIFITRDPRRSEDIGPFRDLGELVDDENRWELKLRPGTRLSEFFELAEKNGIPPSSIELRRPTLEAVFLHLTGRRLRD
jgi:ABC-2 type transport system ATP-binding protein